MTHSYGGHNSQTHTQRSLRELKSALYMRNYSFIWVTWIALAYSSMILGIEISAERGRAVMGGHYICDMTHSYGWHDLHARTQRLFRGLESVFERGGAVMGGHSICDMTNSYRGHDISVTWLIHIGDMTRIHMLSDYIGDWDQRWAGQGCHGPFTLPGMTGSNAGC